MFRTCINYIACVRVMVWSPRSTPLDQINFVSTWHYSQGECSAFFDGLPLPCTTVNTNLGLGIKPGQIQHVMWNWKCLHSFLPTGLWRLGGLWCWGCSSWWLHFGFLATHTVWETEGSKSWNQGHGGIVPSSLRNERGQQMPCPREQHWHRLNLIMGSRSATSTGLINNVNHQPSLQ